MDLMRISVMAGLVLALLCTAQAAEVNCIPSSSGDWTIGGTVVCENRAISFNRPGYDIVITGSLTLRNVSLSMNGNPPNQGSSIISSGRLTIEQGSVLSDLADTGIGFGPGSVILIEDSTMEYRGSISGGRATLRNSTFRNQASLNILGNAQVAIEDCQMADGISASGSSTTTVLRTRLRSITTDLNAIVNADACNVFEGLTLTKSSKTTVSNSQTPYLFIHSEGTKKTLITDLRKGLIVSNTVTSPNTPFLIDLINTTVANRIDISTRDSSDTAITNTDFYRLDIWPGGTNYVTVANLAHGYVADNTVLSNPGAYTVHISNSNVAEIFVQFTGSSVNQITSAVFQQCSLSGTSKTTINGSVSKAGSSVTGDATLIASNSTFDQEIVFTTSSQNNMVIGSAVKGQFIYRTAGPGVDFPFPQSKLANGYIGDCRDTNSYTAAISGEVDMPPALLTFCQGYTVNRKYPIYLKYLDNSPAAGILLTVKDGATTIWSGTTDASGYLNASLSFNNKSGGGNVNKVYNISVAGYGVVRDIALLTDTPIRITLGAIRTLNCSGYSITGNGMGYGISASNSGNIAIKNCTVQKFETGIFLNVAVQSIIGNILNINLIQSAGGGGALTSSGSNNLCTTGSTWPWCNP